MKINITKTDLKKAGAYLDTHNCLICTSVRRHFKLAPQVTISAGPGMVSFQHQRFYFDCDPVCDAYDNNGRGPISPSAKPFTLLLSRGV